MADFTKMRQALRAKAEVMLNTTSPVFDKTVARVLMIVEYESTPQSDELTELLDKAREYGGVAVGLYEHLARTLEDLERL